MYTQYIILPGESLVDQSIDLFGRSVKRFVLVDRSSGLIDRSIDDDWLSSVKWFILKFGTALCSPAIRSCMISSVCLVDRLVIWLVVWLVSWLVGLLVGWPRAVEGMGYTVKAEGLELNKV